MLMGSVMCCVEKCTSVAVKVHWQTYVSRVAGLRVWRGLKVQDAEGKLE